MANEKIDVAIVGGGVSGVYSAWRLKKANPKSKVVVFEASGHIGGRLLSVKPPDIPNMVAELGGMRILPAVQPLITRLLEVLNSELPPDQQIETYKFPVDEPQNIAYLRGAYLRLSDFTQQPGKVPYNLNFLEKGGTAGSIITNAIEQIVPGITNPKLNDNQRRKMAQSASFCDKPLYQQGFWNVLARIISGEAYQLCVDSGGYDSTLSNWNAADAIPWYLSDFGVNPEYRGFKKGFQQVPKSLADLFAKEQGEVRLSTPLTGFDWSDGGIRLEAHGQTIEASSLILAMPRRSLDLLAPASPPLQNIQHLITSVTPRPLFKLFTTYANPWWLAAGFTNSKGEFVPVEAGRTVTDLPVRQTYYWPEVLRCSWPVTTMARISASGMVCGLDVETPGAMDAKFRSPASHSGPTTLPMAANGLPTRPRSRWSTKLPANWLRFTVSPTHPMSETPPSAIGAMIHSVAVGTVGTSVSRARTSNGRSSSPSRGGLSTFAEKPIRMRKAGWKARYRLPI
jgi:hypothetical protein